MGTAKVKAFAFQELSNAKFVGFFATFIEILKSKNNVCLALQPLVDELDRLMVLLEASLVASRTNSYTKLVNEADEHRDMLHAALIHLLRAYEKCGDTAKMNAARQLLVACKEFGFSDLRKTNHVEETALLDSQMEVLKGDKFTDALATLSEVSVFLTALETAMNDFKTVFNSKASEASEKLDYTTMDIRVQVIPVYRQIVGASEAMAAVGTEPQYAELISELNGLIAVS